MQDIHSFQMYKIFIKVGHIVDHKICFNTFQKIEFVLSVFFDNNVLKLKIDNIKISRNAPNNWRLNNALLDH